MIPDIFVPSTPGTPQYPPGTPWVPPGTRVPPRVTPGYPPGTPRRTPGYPDTPPGYRLVTNQDSPRRWRTDRRNTLVFSRGGIQLFFKYLLHEVWVKFGIIKKIVVYNGNGKHLIKYKNTFHICVAWSLGKIFNYLEELIYNCYGKQLIKYI